MATMRVTGSMLGYPYAFTWTDGVLAPDDNPPDSGQGILAVETLTDAVGRSFLSTPTGPSIPLALDDPRSVLVAAVALSDGRCAVTGDVPDPDPVPVPDDTVQ